ncbi:MAG TPA: hypothetical protein VI729_06255 [Anaerolineales bacterium]|nr:hypothetical protein [Anaerolineales bacterium]
MSVPSEPRDLVPEVPIPIGLYSVLSVTDLRIKRASKPWRTVRAMVWRPEELAEFFRQMLAGRKQSNEMRRNDIAR